jgi:hypothetical protein
VRQSAVVSRRVAVRREQQNLKRKRNTRVLDPAAKAAVWFTPKKADRDA